MKALLSVTAAIEAGAGLALLIAPVAVIGLLLGSTLDAPAGWMVARTAGAALLALGIACWTARNNGRSQAAIGLVSGMLLYNVAAVVLVSTAALGYELVGIGTWPAILLHLAMAIWCGVCLGQAAKGR